VRRHAADSTSGNDQFLAHDWLAGASVLKAMEESGAVRRG